MLSKKFGTDRAFLFWMLAPASLVLLVFTAYPIFNLIGLMFSQVELTEIGFLIQFTGLENWKRLISDQVFISSVFKTLIYMAGSVGGEVVLGMTLALLVSQGLKVSGPLRAVLLLPMMISPVAVGLIWRLLYNPEFGLINTTLKAIGLPAVGWLSDANAAMAAIILSDIWQWTAYVYLILLAGLESLPREPFESAEVDGATAWQQFWYVTLPMLKPTLFVAVLFRALDALKAFDKVVILTQGGPGDATELASLFAYKITFRYWELGYGSLIAGVLIMIGALLSWSLNKLIRSGDSNDK
jgi:ABC-type sugar transport systems, permease components